MEGMLNYFIPEDGDSSDHMNVVPLPRVDQLKLQHVKKSFPLRGDFHFRFKTPFEGTYVWLDVTNDTDPVPDYNGLIVSKIARVQRESTTRPAERVEVKAAPAPKVQQPAPDLIETSPPPPAKREEPAAPAKAFNDDLVGLLSDPIPASSPRTTPAPAAPTPAQSPGAPADPFNLFLGPAQNTAPMRPTSAPMSGPRGPAGPVSGPGGYSGSSGFSPMGASGVTTPMAPRPGSMNISQMGQHMGMGQAPGPGVGNSFSGLQWQGMGHNQQQQQPRPGMGMPPNANGRQW